MKEYHIRREGRFYQLLSKPLYRGLLYVTLSLIVTLIISFLFYNFNVNRIQSSTDTEQFDKIELMVSDIQNNLRLSSSPLMLATENKSLLRIIEEDNNQCKVFFAEVLLAQISNMDNIDQIRILDIEGNELIRVNRDNLGQCSIVEEEELQNKADRYYFKETIAMKDDDIYISPLDLNIEYGELEIPLNPMVRMGKTIRNTNGEVIGAMIINIKGKEILDSLKSFKAYDNDNISLLNSHGYYLSGGGELDFSFMYSDKVDVGFFSEYPDVWSEVLAGNEITNYNNSRFYMEEMNPVNINNDLNKDVKWYIVIEMHSIDIMESQRSFDDAMRLILLILIPVLVLLSYLLGVTQSKNLLYKEDLLKSSTYDSLTGLYNRRIIMKMLHQLVGLSKRNGQPLSVLYIDVNNLKTVNDNIGHTMGDKMIVAAADSIRNSVRSSDLVARIGGDEFLVVLPNCSEENVSLITTKIASAFSKAGIEYLKDPWEMSYGCAVLRENETVNQFIQRADRYMYVNKRAKKGS